MGQKTTRTAKKTNIKYGQIFVILLNDITPPFLWFVFIISEALSKNQ
jgi:hypothetical protein